jgi:hypothetical protein
LDLSGSTNGLVDNLRDKMWDVINQWSMFSPRPQLRIGIVGMARVSFTNSGGYVKILCDLTDDYDVLSHELHNLSGSVENGYQFIGAALDISVNSMDWSTNADALKIIYLVGNGKVNEGRFDFRKQCEHAKEKNIIVNTIYCNKTLKDNRAKDITGWIEIASSTDGQQYDVYVSKRAPLLTVKANLADLIALNDTINETYLPYGRTGFDKFKLMKAADKCAGSVYESYLYSRLKYKLSDHYQLKQFAWDIITYKKTYPDTKLAAIKASVNKDSNATGGLNLEEFVNKNLEARENLLQDLIKRFPVGEEKRVQTEIGYPDYDLGAMLDRILIVSFYQLAVNKGFVPEYKPVE